MIKKYFVFVIALIASSTIYGQTDFNKNFKEWSEEAFLEYQNGNYNTSADLNVKIYKLLTEYNFEEKYNYAYNAACTYAMAGKKDDAFKWLELLLEKEKLYDYKFREDPDLENLKNDFRWKELIKSNSIIEEDMTEKYKNLSIELQEIYDNDQQIRFKLMNLNSKLNRNNDSDFKKSFTALIKKMKKIDSLNLIKVNSIIKEYGWLSSDKVGFEPSQALFLVIQHSDLKTQKLYLPIIRDAAEKGYTLKSNLAIFEDRIALREGTAQIYGSQIWTNPQTGDKYVDLLRDPLTVDQRRAQVNLPPMKTYLQEFFDMNWDPLEYINDILPRLKSIKNLENKN